MTHKVIRGKAWVGGDHIYAFDIIQQAHWHKALDPEENSKWVMAGVAPEFQAEGAFKSFGCTFVVAGANFAGGGKSIEHPIVGLMGAGVQAVIAESFSRLQFRNAINRGLPFIVCKGIRDIVATGDELEVDLDSGRIRNLTNGKELLAPAMPDFVREIAAYGGLINYVREMIKNGSF